MADTTDSAALTAQQAQVQADEIAARVRAQAERVREQQAAALAITGSATSKDGTVRVVVDGTGVVTALEFSASALDNPRPERLAATVVATIQEAAAQARGRTAEALESFREPDSPVLAAAEDGTARLGLPRIGVPEVPRTATDPTGQADAWTPDRATPPGAPRPARRDFASDESFDDVRPW